MNLNEYRVLRMLYDNEKPFFFRELSIASGISIGGTQQALKNHSAYLIKKKEGKNTYYSLKKDTKTFYLRLSLEIMKLSIFLDKKPLFTQLIEYLNDNNVPSIIFGSYADETFKKDSDLDLLIISNKKIPDHLFPVKAHVINMTKQQFLKSINNKEPLIIEIRRKHVIINNFDFFVKTLKGEKNE